MTREDQRRENARVLAAHVGGLAEFGRKMGMENSQVSQIIGKTPSKNIGNNIARRIEVAFGLPENALDGPLGEMPPTPVLETQRGSLTLVPQEADVFRRHWLRDADARFLANYWSLTDKSRRILEATMAGLERDPVDISDADKSK